MRAQGAFGMAVLTAALTILVGCGKKADEAVSQPPSPGPTPQPQPGEPLKKSSLGEPKYRFNVPEITKECIADAKVANTKYSGAVVEVKGVASYMPDWGGSDDLRDMSLRIRFIDFSAGKMAIVDCRGVSRSHFGKIFKGQQVRLKGRVQQVDQSATLTMLSSEILEVGPDVAVDMASREVAVSCLKSAYELRQKCKDLSLRISGKVIGKVVEGRKESYELEGDGKTRVLCRVNPDHDIHFKPVITVGESVTFAGVPDDLADVVPGQVCLEGCYPLLKGQLPAASQLMR